MVYGFFLAVSYFMVYGFLIFVIQKKYIANGWGGGNVAFL